MAEDEIVVCFKLILFKFGRFEIIKKKLFINRQYFGLYS